MPEPTRADTDSIEVLQAEITALRKDLWSTRDALIGAQAEAASLKVYNRELEVRLGQVQTALDQTQFFGRLSRRIRNHTAVRAVGRTAKKATGRSAG